MKKQVRRIRKKESEKELWVDGEFCTEDDMRKELKLSEPRVAAIKEDCKKKRGAIRRALVCVCVCVCLCVWTCVRRDIFCV